MTSTPADYDFVVDGLYAGLVLNVFSLTGTNMSVTATDLIDGGFDLAYDAQTANFTVGRRIRQEFTNASGVIVDDTDGGATGTLRLKRVTGNFADNYPIFEESVNVPGQAHEPAVDPSVAGRAVANGTPTRVLIEDQVWADTGVVTSGNSGIIQFVNPNTGAGDLGRIWPRRFRLKFTFNATAADFAVDLIQSEVK